MLTNTPIITVKEDCLSYSVLSTSVDETIKDMENHPEVIEFLTTSKLGFEYLSVDINHGDQLFIKLHK